MSTPLAVTPINGGNVTPGNPPVQAVLYAPDGDGGWQVVDLENLGGGASLNYRGDYNEAATYAEGDYVQGPSTSDTALFLWLATEDIPAGGAGPDLDPAWSPFGVSQGGFSYLFQEIRKPVQIADLAFDPGTQAELDAAVAGAVSSLTAELNLRAPVKPRLYVKGRGQIQAVGSLGHSLLAGVALADPTAKRPTAQLAALATGLTDGPNLAVGGSDLLVADPASGGWGRLWNALDMRSGATAVPNLFALWSGLNGVASYFAAYSTPGASGDMVREAVISYMRAAPGSYRRISDGSFAFSGPWSDGTVDASTANMPSRFATALEASFSDTFTMAEAGTRVICFLENSAFGGGGKWEITEGSTVLATVDGSATNSGGYHPVVVRIPNLAAGQHTLKVTCKGLNGYNLAMVLGVWSERAYPPVVLDTLQFKPSSYAAYAGFAHPPVDGDVDMLNTRIRAVDGLFDDYVIPVPTDALIGRSLGRLSPADGLHLTDASSQLPAMAYLKALVASPTVSTSAL